jgi:hypothetical protein
MAPPPSVRAKQIDYEVLINMYGRAVAVVGLSFCRWYCSNALQEVRLQLGWRALWAADSFGRVSTGTFLHDGLHVHYICMTLGRLAIRLCRRGLVVFWSHRKC